MENIIYAILGSGALAALVSGFFNAWINRKGRLGKIEETLGKIEKNQAVGEKDALRTQLLLMLSDYPHETTEILKLAEHYFKDLEGNWYLTSLFNNWLIDNKIASPSWFEKGGKCEG